MSHDVTITIDLNALRESPFNPRRIYHDGRLQELADSIAIDGVLQPILVRPLAGDALEEYEIVFGHRRYRASLLARCAGIRAIVRAMTDEEARRAQLVENLQRDDVHAIEEAEGFAALMREHGITADQLVTQTGKSRSYIYGRLKLTALCSEVREACLAGDIGAEAALLVARLHGEKVQRKALQAIKGRGQDLADGGKQSYRRIRALLVEQFSLELKTAMWSLEDATLLPDAGACTTCPKRSGNAPELYGDVVNGTKRSHYDFYSKKGADICTDPECFAAKKAAHFKRTGDALAATGKTVVTGNAARAAISATGEVKGAYVALQDVRAQIKQAKGTKPATVLIQDPRTGKTVEAVKRADLEAAGVNLQEPKKDRWAEAQAQVAKRKAHTQAQAEAMTQQRLEVLDRTLEAMRNAPRSIEELALIARQAFGGTDWDGRCELAKRHGFATANDLRAALARPHPADWLALFAVECALIEDAMVEHYDLSKAWPTLSATARRYGIEPEPASTPSSAARAHNGAPKKAKGLAASLFDDSDDAGEDDEQTDDAGDAGGSGATASEEIAA